MAKALINKGIPIKADDPKDPYIRDEASITSIVNANTTTFGKALKVSNHKIQLKNGNSVLSEVTVPATNLYTVGYPEVDTNYKPIYPGAETAITLWGMPLDAGTYYMLTVENDDLTATGTIEAVEYNDHSITFSINCSGINDTIESGSFLYIYVDSASNNHYVCTGYKDLPSVNVDYESVKVGKGLVVEDNTLKAIGVPEIDTNRTNQVVTLKEVDSVFSYQLDSIVGVYTGSCTAIDTDITWNYGEDISQDDIIEEAKNFLANFSSHKSVVISISINYNDQIMLYPTTWYIDENTNDTVVFSSTIYDGTNVYLYSITMVKNGSAAKLKRVTLV